MSLTFVYFIQSGENGPIKIGVARNIEKRIEDLQIGNPCELHLLCTMPCDSKNHAFFRERQLHKIFSKQRIRGEWFENNIKFKNLSENFSDFIHKKFKKKEKHRQWKEDIQEEIEIIENLDLELIQNIPF